jgi:DNA gyrase subunit A
MIINKSGVAIRMNMDEMRVMGRNTQGVRMINLKKNDEIAAIAKVEMDKDVAEEDEENEEGTEIIADNQENNTEAPQTENENSNEETESSDSEE